MSGGDEGQQGTGPSTAGEQGTTLDSDKILKEMEILRSRKKHRRMILIAAVCVVISILAIQAILSELSITPSQRRIINANDLGSNWEVTKPEKPFGDALGASDSAEVRIGFNRSQVEGYCTLRSYASLELANNSYKSSYESITKSDSRWSAIINVTLGDRAVLANYSSDRGNWMEWMLIQKGTSIVRITLISDFGPGIETDQMIRIAGIQAAKLP